jgi:ABC-2 type transport system ATP-binding protein
METDALKIKNMMGYLPESAPLYPSMLVFDYLDYVAAIRNLRGSDRLARLKALSELCGLDQIMHRPIGELSKGLKQRVGLAHAMMSDPEILVLDEPTSGLDPNQIAEIREIIRRIGREKTVILSTHILSEAEATCDRIVIIHRGKVVADGGTDAIRQSLGGGHCLHLTLAGADAGEVEKRLGSIDGVCRISLAGEEALRIQIDCRPGLDPRPEIYAKIKETDWTLMEFFLEIRTLESIFRELTKEN